MRNYLRFRAVDWVLCTLMTLAMAFTICSGFVLTDALSGNFAAVLLLAALLQGIFLLFALQRSTMILGIATGAILGLFAFLYVRAMHPLENESANSLFLFFLILIVTGILIFLLSRTRTGSIVLFLVGILLICGTQFLQFPAPKWSFFLFLTATALLLFYRCYTASLKTALLGQVRILRYAGQSFLLVLLAAVFAAGVFYAVIAPIAPPTQELRLITTLQSMDLLQVLGVSSVRTVLDPTLASNEPPEQTEYDRDMEEDPSEPEQPEEPDSQTAPEQPDQVLPDENEPEDPIPQQTIRYDLPTKNKILLVILVILVILIAPPAARLLAHSHWHRKVQALPHDAAAVSYYTFFLSRLKKAGIPRTETYTLKEYTADNEFQLSAYMTDTVRFADLTAVYERVVYGNAEVSETDYQKFEQYYSEFYRNLRQELGFWRYYLQLFRF